MRNIIILSFIAIFTLACNPKDDPILLIVGDSWGEFLCDFDSFGKQIKNAGFKNKRVECHRTTEIGSKAHQWATNNKLKTSKKLLKAFHNLKTVYISLGGNDLLEKWHKDMSNEEASSLLDTIADNIEDVIEQLNTTRSDLEFVISGYDFPNFDLLLPGDALSSYRRLYLGMKEPTAFELNSIIIKFSHRIELLAQKHENIHFIPTVGLGQHYFGQDDYGYEPGELPAPSYDLITGGEAEIPQARDALLNINNTPVVDPYHLSKKGYEFMSKHIMDLKLKELLER